MPDRFKKIVLGVAALAALGLGAGAIAQAGPDGKQANANSAQHENEGSEQGENDRSATGPAAEQARSAALAITGGGTANSVERDSENGATWEVEVTKPDGSTVDVRLDDSFNKVVVEGDSER